MANKNLKKGAGQIIAKIMNSDYSPNITSAVQTNSKYFQLYSRGTYWLPMFTFKKSVCFCKEEFYYNYSEPV